MRRRARELSEECIQHALDRMEVQMLALIMQAEHKGHTTQFKRFSKQSTNQATFSICLLSELLNSHCCEIPTHEHLIRHYLPPFRVVRFDCR